MVTEIRNVDGNGKNHILPNDGRFEIRSNHLYYLKRPGRYEITNFSDNRDATAIEEHADPVKNKRTPGVKPEILIEDGEVVELPVVQDRQAFTVTVVNFISEAHPVEEAPLS